MAGIEYFNFFNLFVNEVCGNVWLFMLIMAAIIFGVGSFYKVPWKVNLMLFVTFFLMFSAFTTNYFVFIIYVVAILLAITLGKLYHER